MTMTRSAIVISETWRNFVKTNTNCEIDSIEVEYIHNIENFIFHKGATEALALSFKARSLCIDAIEARWLADPSLWVRSPLTPPEQSATLDNPYLTPCTTKG